MVAGCYLGREPEWQAATDAWASVLRDAGVKLFHATDFFNCYGEFKGWTLNDERHVAFAKRFSAIADDAGLIGFAFGLDSHAFLSILAPVLAQEKRKHTAAHPRTFAVMKAITRVALFLEKAKHPIDERVQIIFEAEQGGGRFDNFFRESQKQKEPWTRWFSSFTTDDKSLIPLQIADLLAHENWRRVKAFLEDPSTEARKTFVRMVSGGGVELELLDRNRAVENAAYATRVLQLSPLGLAPRLYGDGEHDDTVAFQWHLAHGVPLQTPSVGYLVRAESLRLPSGMWLSSGLRPRPYTTRLAVERGEAEDKIRSSSLNEDPTT